MSFLWHLGTVDIEGGGEEVTGGGGVGQALKEGRGQQKRNKE